MLAKRSIIKLKFVDWAPLTQRTLDLIESYAKINLIDASQVFNQIFITGMTTNPHSTQFGELKIYAAALERMLQSNSTTHRGPQFQDISSVFKNFPDLKDYYQLRKRGKAWNLKFKKKYRHLKAKDWSSHDWSIAFRNDQGIFIFNIPGADFLPLMNLFSYLNGGSRLRDLESLFPSHRDLLLRFLKFADTHDLIEQGEQKISSPIKNGVEFCSHASLAFWNQDRCALIDPCFRLHDGEDTRKIDLDRLNLLIDSYKNVACVLITHHHWDHCYLQTLVRLSRDIPIYVPRVKKLSPQNPSIAHFLKSLGFLNVREVDYWKSIRTEIFEFVALPFLGEWFGPFSAFDGFCYLIEYKGKSYVGTVDSDRNERGNMVPVLKELAQKFKKIDFLFACSSASTHSNPLTCGGPWFYSNDRKLISKNRLRYHPDSKTVLGWCRILRPRVFIPYAAFIFHNRRIRAPFVVSKELPDLRIFNEYWEDSLAPSHSAFFSNWKKSLQKLRKNLRKQNTKLLMLGPGESVSDFKD